MEFIKYNSIENSFRQEFINSIYDQGFSGDEFIVQEKVHGANFSFYTDGKEIKYAKRTQLIDSNESFFNHKLIAEKYKNKLFKVFEIVKQNYPETIFISVIGEIFGGIYPHKDVLPNNNSVIVQNGIWYCPYNDFYAFDILINNKHFLDVYEINEIFEKVGFFYAKTLFSGNFKNAINFSNKFNSQIPDWLGLPTIDENICEGTIIKPNKTVFLKNGSRLIIKNKNEKWEEKMANKSPKPDLTLEISAKSKEILFELEKYLTLNRLNNLLSKLGGIQGTDSRKISGLLIKDILDEFTKDFGNILKDIDNKEKKLMNSYLNNEAAKLIRSLIISQENI